MVFKNDAGYKSGQNNHLAIQIKISEIDPCLMSKQKLKNNELQQDKKSLMENFVCHQKSLSQLEIKSQSYKIITFLDET